MKRTTKRLQHFTRAEGFSATPIGAALVDWLNNKSLELSETTVKGYRSKAKLIDKHFKRQELCSIRPRCVRGFIEKLHKRGYSNKTINEYLIVLRGVFRGLVEDEEIPKDPTRTLQNLRTVITGPDPFTREEIAKMTSVPGAQVSEMAMLKLGLYTGLRVSELLALAWEDVDLARRTLHVRRARVNGIFKTPKNRASDRVISLPQHAADLLLSLQPLSGKPRLTRSYSVTLEDNRTQSRQRLRIVFLNSNTGEPIKTDSHYARYFLGPLLNKAGVRYRSPNNCRHTWASQMLTQGVPAAWIARQLGHTSEQMIYRHYGKIIEQDMPDFVEQQEQVFAAVA
ncbi:site-specific integrase [Marinobacter salinisoli]|uniref:Site-specific integrase n=1 Tax=Marinobacter salinisoli TaxID=2769486 RepID=A0ABX7MP15_9GAMM|nr:site-specific integrase [Marinobacter salinisoli]QSP94021.1 site-specific integrase [Marinobacter salinisoli]